MTDANRPLLRAQLGAALQRRRLLAGLTQARLAEAADVSPKYVGEVERGTTNPTLDAIEKLSTVLGWEPLDLFEAAREPITEGVRQHLLSSLKRTRVRFIEMEGWLRALDPHRQVGVPNLPPPLRQHSRSRASSRRQLRPNRPGGAR